MSNILYEAGLVARNWLRRRKAFQLVARDQKRIRAEIRAGKDPEDVLGGFDLKFGLKVLRYFWIPPAVTIGGTFAYAAWRVKYDLNYCYYLLAECNAYDHVTNLIWKIELVRPQFRQELFDQYTRWLEDANNNPEQFVQDINFAQFDKWCDWIEKLKYETEREERITAQIQEPPLPMLRGNTSS
mmetsp:Transcript_7543/g.12334  ORF Transcript_7543/g.12334 Transcript_7543/m.12334 type:complete len:184 (+) Transcript_7543:17-568(+)